MDIPAHASVGSDGTTSDGTSFDLSGPLHGLPVVLIHGIGLNRGIWDDIAAPLSVSHRVIRYDLYGHGQSAPTIEPVDLRLLGNQAVGLMDHLDIERAVLIGFSLGGMVNRRVAIDNPNRVAGLAILNSPHEREPAAQRLVEERAAATASGDLAATLDATLSRWLTPQALAEKPELVERVRRLILANDIETFAEVRQVLAQGVTELIRPDPPISTPALIITTEHDSGSTPTMAKAISAEIAGSTTVIVPGLQHLGLLEDADPFTRSLKEFLADRVR